MMIHESFDQLGLGQQYHRVQALAYFAYPWVVKGGGITEGSKAAHDQSVFFHTLIFLKLRDGTLQFMK